MTISSLLSRLIPEGVRYTPCTTTDATQSIAGFFGNLYNDLTVFALAIAVFFLAWAGILYMASGTTNEREKQAAKAAIYAALAGLAIALLAQLIAGIVQSAVPVNPTCN